MNIDLDIAREEFLKYTKRFDLKNENIKRKQIHSLRVMQISEQIANSLGLNCEQIKVATLIGLLHDIARFEQYTQFNTFKDLQSFDHGDYALKILDEDIRKYVISDKYDDLIKIAIKNHNKYKIDDNLNEEELLYSKIIRDADKIDIFYEAVEMFWSDLEEQINNSKISKDIETQFRNKTQIKRRKNSSNIHTVDNVISVIAFIYDINFEESFKILVKNDYINKILDRFDFKDEETKYKINEIRKVSNIYINEKVRRK